MRSTNPYITDGTFKQRHEHTARTNMSRGISYIFNRVWFIDDEEYVTEKLHIECNLIDEFIAQENTDVADDVDIAILNAFLTHIVSNAEEFMSPHQVACLTALILASCQDGPTRVSTLDVAKNELILWQQEHDPATKIQKGILKAKFAARTASEIAEKAADEKIKAEYVEVINRIAAVAQKAAESTEKFRPFIEEDSGDTEGLRDAAQEVTKAVNLSEEAVKTAEELLKISSDAKGEAIMTKQRFIEAERDFLGTHEA